MELAWNHLPAREDFLVAPYILVECNYCLVPMPMGSRLTGLILTGVRHFSFYRVYGSFGAVVTSLF